MKQTMQDEFEADYCTHAHRLPALVKNCRLSNGSYGDPCIAKAWHWFKRSREMLVVELPDDGLSDALQAWPGRAGDNFDCGYNFATDRITSAIQATGVKVNS